MTAFSQHFKMSQQHYRTLSRLCVVVASGVVVLLCNRIVGLFDSPHTWTGMSPNGQSHTLRSLKWIGEDPLLKPHNLRDDSNVEVSGNLTTYQVNNLWRFPVTIYRVPEVT